MRNLSSHICSYIWSDVHCSLPLAYHRRHHRNALRWHLISQLNLHQLVLVVTNSLEDLKFSCLVYRGGSNVLCGRRVFRSLRRLNS